MSDTYAQTPFREAVPALMNERGLTLTGLAREAGVSASYLSRVLRGQEYKTPGPELARKIAIALKLPPDYFPEYREGFVVAQIRSDRRLRDELYLRLRAR